MVLLLWSGRPPCYSTTVVRLPRSPRGACEARLLVGAHQSIQKRSNSTNTEAESGTSFP